MTSPDIASRDLAHDRTCGGSASPARLLGESGLAAHRLRCEIDPHARPVPCVHGSVHRMRQAAAPDPVQGGPTPPAADRQRDLQLLFQLRPSLAGRPPDQRASRPRTRHHRLAIDRAPRSRRRARERAAPSRSVSAGFFFEPSSRGPVGQRAGIGSTAFRSSPRGHFAVRCRTTLRAEAPRRQGSVFSGTLISIRPR